ncbi:MAG: hypothetical protein M3460_06715 [Actinomycetota bacterium]|nr:hypothetical protein [Actinomycetota bacterium]
MPTVWRTLDEIAAGGPRALFGITAAVNAARRRVWAGIEARHGAIPGVRIADQTLEGVTCIRLDAMVVPAHPDKQGADHLRVLDEAIAALPAQHRRRLMVTADGAGASHGLITRVDQLASRPGHQLIYSVGGQLSARERAAITLVPAQAWQITLNHHGQLRHRRAEQACANPCCMHARC